MADAAHRPFPRVSDGTLLLYRLFDVAEDIDLARAEGLLAGEAARLKLAGERSGFLDLPDRPLTVALGPREVRLEDGTVLRGAAAVRLFGLGVASARYEVPIPKGSGAPELAALVRSASDSALLEKAARAEVAALCERVRPALDNPWSSPLFETYAIVFVRAFEGGAAPETVAGPDLARVLLGEPPSADLSPRTVSDVTRHRFSYESNDLCVLDWDAAFIVEPSGDRSAADVLELATAQLLELRFFDGLFERELLGVAELVGRPRRATAWFFVGRYAKITRRIQQRVVDSVEFIARVENTVRFVGDLYLARVHRAAAERFRIPEWTAEVLRRQEVAARVSGLLSAEADSALGHVLEATIILLIVLEIVLAFAR
jgi:hypothetical protein